MVKNLPAMQETWFWSLGWEDPLQRGYPLQYSFFFFFFLNFFKFYFIFKLYITVLVLPNIKMNPPQVYMCSPSWTLLPPPSPFHPSGLSQCTSPKHPVSCIEGGKIWENGIETCKISCMKWVATPVFLPGESHGQMSLAGYGPWGRKESDTTKLSHFQYFSLFY